MFTKSVNAQVHKEGRLIVFAFTGEIFFFFFTFAFYVLRDPFKTHLCERKAETPRVTACKTQCTTAGLMENKACKTWLVFL